MNELYLKLNESQQEVVKSTEGPVLVLAGAGSGKTLSIVHRIAYLISEKRVSPWHILAVTFTNKAANEMKSRLEKSFKISTKSLWIGTFHSMCARILRIESQYLPFSSNFTIFDANDQNTIIKKIMKNLNISSKQFHPSKVKSAISFQKNNLISWQEYEQNYTDSFYTKILAKVYKAYQQYLVKNNGMDFDDLLFYVVNLFKKNSKVLEKYQNKFEYIMIDEYQDTNYAQYKIVYELGKKYKNVCVVGDDDQSIYGWRGADIYNILSFENDYQNAKVIPLVQNYRSTRLILKAANSVISNNRARHKKELWTKKHIGNRIKIVELDNENEEAMYVAQKIKEIICDNNVSLNDIAVLYRTNAQSRVFESEFLNANINYRVIGGINFYQRKEIKDVLAYLRILANPRDNESFLRIVNFPKRHLGNVSIGKLIDFANQKAVSLRESLEYIEQCQDLSNNIKDKFQKFNDFLLSYEKKAEILPINELMNNLVDDLKLLSIYEQQELVSGETRADMVKELVASAEEFTSLYKDEFGKKPKLNEYLQQVSLITDIDRTDSSENSVSLMTMHNAKGLEFSYVFIVGAEDGLIPHKNSIEEKAQLEEERRLFYVSITRAKHDLYITYANCRRYYDYYNFNRASRFIDEIDPDTVEYTNKQFERTYQIAKKKINICKEHSANLLTNKEFQVGSKIIHKTFGKGTVLGITKNGAKAKLTIAFESGRIKKIIDSFVEKI